MTSPADGSLYARLGGGEAVKLVTGRFYAAVLDDPLLAPHFAGVDMTVQAGMLASFLSMAAGGPGGYRGRDLRDAHAALRIGDPEFDRVVTLLAAALKAAGVSDGAIGELAGVAETVRGDVLGR
jgi:truncated hemoglobin YjbI